MEHLDFSDKAILTRFKEGAALSRAASANYRNSSFRRLEVCTKEASAKSCLFKEWSNAGQENRKQPAADAKCQFNSQSVL
jgi:hypothetical protein